MVNDNEYYQTATAGFSDFKIILPWVYGLGTFMLLFYFFSKYLRRRRERELELAWMDWVDARKREGLYELGAQSYMSQQSLRDKERLPTPPPTNSGSPISSD
jgi:hypothetical protein